MRLIVLPALACSLVCSAAFAQLNALYKGVERIDGKENPASARIAIQPGRIALVLKGARSARLVFSEKDGVLRFIDDAEKTYFDLDEQAIVSIGATAAAMMAEMEAQLAQLPPEQRKMAEQMLKGRVGAGAQTGSKKAAPKPEYVWTRDKNAVLGYECTRVEIVEGGAKVAEYCASSSKDFKISDGERRTLLAMQKLVESFAAAVSPLGGKESVQTRAFQWDASVDGYPLSTRAFEEGQATLDLQLEAFDRKPLPAALFDVPADYARQSLPQTP